MAWDKREAVQNLVVLGDGEGQVQKLGGLLIGTPMDLKYKDKMNYLIVLKDGEEVVLGGNATLSRQLSPADVGKFVKFAFQGWSAGGPNGKYKLIEVQVWNGEILPEMKAWPRFAEFQRLVAPAQQQQAQQHKPAASAEAAPAEEELPF